MKYFNDDRNKAPVGQPIWGLAYDVNDDTERHDLKCEPVLGEIIEDGNSFKRRFFVPYKKGTTEKRQSGLVHLQSRMYADTYEEAIDMYNTLVQNRIEKLYRMIECAKSDMIGRYKDFIEKHREVINEATD